MSASFKLVFMALIVLALGFVLVSLVGPGGFKRKLTLTGIYTVCRPDNYDVVCFLDADSKEGGLFCVPLANAGGKCTK